MAGVGGGSDDDLVTAHSSLGPPTPRDADNRTDPGEESTNELEGFADDLEVQIQRRFGSVIGEHMTSDFSTALILDAIEAQIDNVIRNIGGNGEGQSDVDAAIIARFHAKNLSVDEAAIPCQAGELPEARRATPAIPAPTNPSSVDLAVTAFGYLTVCCVLALVVFGFERSSVFVCGYGCPCSFGQSAIYAWSFYLLFQAPRCMFFAFVTVRLVTLYRGEAKGTSMMDTLKRPRSWLLGVLSLLFACAVEMAVSSLDAPLYYIIPARAFAMALPDFIYIVVHRSILCAPPIIWLQLIPIIFQIVLPQYVPLTDPVVVLWPVFVGAIDRLLLYMLWAMMPECADGVFRTVSVHVTAFYAQAVVVATVLHFDIQETPGLVAIYALLVGGLEFLFSTHWVDRIVLSIANKVGSCCKSNDESSDFSFGGHDLRLMSAYSRHATFTLALAAVVPLLGIRSWPLNLNLVDCWGTPQAKPFWWGSWAVVVLAHVLAVGGTLVRRHVGGAMKRPLLIPCPFWATWCAAYLAFIAPLAFSYLNR